MNRDERESTAAAVLAADDRRRAASVAGDVAALEQILTPDFTYTHNTGFREGREPYLARLRDGGAAITAMERLAASVRLCGDVVLVDGEAYMSAQMPAGAPEFSFKSLYLAVWTKQEGSWRLAAYASTLLPPA